MNKNLCNTIYEQNYINFVHKKYVLSAQYLASGISGLSEYLDQTTK